MMPHNLILDHISSFCFSLLSYHLCSTTSILLLLVVLLISLLLAWVLNRLWYLSKRLLGIARYYLLAFSLPVSFNLSRLLFQLLLLSITLLLLMRVITQLRYLRRLLLRRGRRKQVRRSLYKRGKLNRHIL